MLSRLLIGRSVINYLQTKSITKSGRTIAINHNLKLICTEIIAPSKCVTRTISNYSLDNQNRFRKKHQNYIKVDKLSPEFELIYSSHLTGIVRLSSFVPSFFGILFVTLSAFHGLDVEPFLAISKGPDKMLYANTGLEVYSLCGIYFVIFSLLHLLAKSSVLRLYNYEDKYVAVFASWFPFKYEYHKFSRKEVEGTTKKRFSFFEEVEYKLGSRKGFLLDIYFRTQHDFKKMVSKNIEEEELMERRRSGF